MTLYADRMDTVQKILSHAGELARQYRNEGLAVSSKGLQDFVTQADKAVEDYLIRQLSGLYPDDLFLGEETSLTDRNGNMVAPTDCTRQTGIWVIDPIDGTTNYIQGMDYWCISVGYVVDGVVQLGCIFAPDRDELFHAVRGQGSYLNTQQLQMQTPAPGKAILGLGMSSRHPLPRYLEVIEYLIGHKIEYRRFGAGALMLAHAAAGQTDGYFEAHLNSWDATAGLLLVEEAGGICCDFFANNGLFEGSPIWVAAPGLYEENQAFLLPETTSV